MIASAIIVLALAAAPEVQADDTQQALEAIIESSRKLVPAKSIERTAPKYPLAELRKGREAWVRVAYCIDESGETQNVSILDSVGGAKFDKAALATVKEWKFEPALIDGEPSWQSRNQVYISFALSGDNKGASKRFASQFKKLGKLIDKKELEEADELFWHVHDNYDLSLYELSKLWAQRVRYEGMTGDLYRLDMALHRATASKGEWIDRRSYIRLLKLRAQVEVNIGQYAAAIEAFEELADAAGEDSEEVKALRPVIDKLRDLIGGDQVLRIPAKVRTRNECNSCNNSWTFTPVRNAFALTSIAGKLTSVELRCDHKRFESEVSDLVEWNIPDDWGSCSVNIYGDPGTTFDVLLLPDST